MSVEDATFREIEVDMPTQIIVNQTVVNTEAERFFKRANAALVGVAIIAGLWFCTRLGGMDMDNTDASWANRSGAILVTDHRTGCEYLNGRGGGLTPRLNINGQHMGCRQ